MSEWGLALPRLLTEIPGPASRVLADRLRAVECRNTTCLGERFPVFWDEALGTNVRDADGNVFLDLSGAFGVALAGHGNPLVTARTEVQAEHLVHGMGDVHPPDVKVELLERLAEHSPWHDTQSVLTGSGSEAVEVALKTAALVSGRPGVLAFEGGYHGLTMGALSVTHRDYFRAPFLDRLFRGVAFAPFPTRESEVAPALDVVARSLERGAPDGTAIGAVIVEPIQGRAGVRIPPDGFLGDLDRVARDAGCVMIMDEVFTGFGRTGHLFASEAADAVPDVLCVGKALGGGLPIGACMAPRAIMDAWPVSTGEALHTSTFMAHPLALAGALGFLDELDEGELVTSVAELGRGLLHAVRESMPRDGRVDVRGRGLLVGIELRDPSGGPYAGGGARVAEVALGRGLIVLPAGDQGQVVELAPPATLTAEQERWAVAQLTESVTEVLSAT